MTKIKNYVVNATPSLDDKLIGTDVDINNFTKNFTIRDIASLIENTFTNGGGSNDTRIISGGAVWLSGLTYSVSNLEYVINGNQYTARGVNVTLADADDTNPRIDIIYADSNGNIGVVTGTPSESPLKPFIDQNTQIQVSFVLINAEATAPAGVSSYLVYNENNGSPTEFNSSENTSNTRIQLSSTVSPFIGDKCIYVQKPFDYDNLGFLSTVDYNVSSVDTFSFYIKIDRTFVPTSKISVSLFNNATRLTSDIEISSGDFGLVGNLIGEYQLIVVPISAFSFNDPSTVSFNRVIFYFNELQDSIFSLDYFRFLNGIENEPQLNTYLSLDDTFDESYTGKANYIPIVIDNELGLKLVDYKTLFPTENFIYGIRETSNISGTKEIDLYNFTDFHYTMIGDTTFTFTGVPIGNLVKRFKIRLTGPFIPTFPAWFDIYGNTYNGVYINDILGEISNGNSGSEIGELVVHTRY